VLQPGGSTCSKEGAKSPVRRCRRRCWDKRRNDPSRTLRWKPRLAFEAQSRSWHRRGDKVFAGHGRGALKPSNNVSFDIHAGGFLFDRRAIGLRQEHVDD